MVAQVESIEATAGRRKLHHPHRMTVVDIRPLQSRGVKAFWSLAMPESQVMPIVGDLFCCCTMQLQGWLHNCYRCARLESTTSVCVFSEATHRASEFSYSNCLHAQQQKLPSLRHRHLRYRIRVSCTNSQLQVAAAQFRPQVQPVRKKYQCRSFKQSGEPGEQDNSYQ